MEPTPCRCRNLPGLLGKLSRSARWSAVGACSESSRPRDACCASKPKPSASWLQRLDASFEQAVDLLLACKGRVVVTGMGKSGLIGRKIAATFSSTGTPRDFLHPAEAVHGDLGMLMRDDVVLAVTYGGETEEIIALLETIKRLGPALIDAHRESAIDDCDGERRGARRQREGRSLLAQSGADGFHDCCHGHGRCTGRSRCSTAADSATGFCGAASGRAAGQETSARGRSDARGRSLAARGCIGEDAGRHLRDQQEGPGDDDGGGRARAAWLES